MKNTIKPGQILFTGTTVNDLLFQIEQIVKAKLSIPPKKENQLGYFTRKEVAKLLKVTLPTLHCWTKLGYLKSYKLGTKVLYKQAEVIAALEGLSAIKYKKGVSHG